MTVELRCLLLVTLWTLPLTWAEAFGRARYAGLAWGLSNREGETPPAPAWVERARRARYNHLENLPLFAVVVVALELAHKHDPITEAAAFAFVLARIAHGLIYIAGLTGVRTMAYAAGVLALLALYLRVLS